jgi:hypothetical protein
VRSVYRELPLETEIALLALVRMPRDDRDEEDAGLDLLADRLVPDVAAPERALVEPDFNACGAECFANPLGRLGILRGIAEKHRVRWLGHA